MSGEEDHGSGSRDAIRRGRRGPRVRSGDILLVVVIFALVFIFATFEFTEVIRILYHPVTVLILTVMIVEFLWLKSSDRTRIYRLEGDRLRRLRSVDEQLLRRARDVIKAAVDGPDTEEQGRSGDWHQRAVDVTKDIDSRL